MAKELVISCNRHETKVAVLEDEQLVEIHFQRANEYSLAGSIHKGRVTRVLPGMQSAFVDIGLERDAFLYVSDFVEETEEYDRIPVNLQERAAERTAAELSQASGGRRDRALRRSRRRRLRGHGLAEPKHAQQAAERAEKTETESEFAILPGESLAKYKGLLGEQAPEAAEPPEQQSDEEASGGLLEAAEASAASAEELEPASGDEVEEAAQGFEAPAGLAAAPAENAPELPESLGEAEASAGPQPATQEPGQPESWGEQARAEQEPEGSSQAEEEAAEAGGEEGEPSEVPAETLASEQSTEAPETSPSQAAEEIEPARKPVSLTATLREQGLRYLHRPPRRLRRKMRGGRTQGERAETERGTRKAEAGAEDRPSQPSITDLLREGQEVLVQIAKEPLGQKGARITSHITLPGRYVVYMPTVEHLGVSRKIASDEERARLKRILYRNRGDIPGGFIVRTAGEGRSEEHIAADMRFLYNLWLEIKRKAENSSAPALIHHDLDLVSRTLRDELTDDFKTIWTDNEEVYERVVRFVEKFQPSLVGRVKLYTRPTPIFDAFNISQELEKALRLARIPYHLSGALSLLDRSEVKDALAYLRLIVNPADDAAFLRVVNLPRRDLGSSTLEKLGLAAQARGIALLQAAGDAACLGALARRQQDALREFVMLIERLRNAAARFSSTSAGGRRASLPVSVQWRSAPMTDSTRSCSKCSHCCTLARSNASAGR